jgi:hypothetical protein
MHKLQT